MTDLDPTPDPGPLESVHRWCLLAASAADAKKASDIVIFDVGQVLAITDTFVVVSAPTDRLTRAIAEEIEEVLKAAGGPTPLRVEGMRQGDWVLIDYGDFVVHVFRDEIRRFYDLERLWADAPRVAVPSATRA